MLNLAHSNVLQLINSFVCLHKLLFTDPPIGIRIQYVELPDYLLLIVLGDEVGRHKVHDALLEVADLSEVA